MEEKVFGLPAGLLANSMIVILLAISIILLFGGLRRFILVKMAQGIYLEEKAKVH